MPNLPLAFAELLAGAIIVDAGIKGASIGDVVKGKATQKPITGLSGGATSGTSTGSTTNPANSPFPNLTSWGCTDMGIDATAAPGSPVKAIVAGTVTAIEQGWYQGQPAVFVSSTGLPGGATGIYYAEGLNPSVKVGQVVKAGQQIGTTTSQPTGLEVGFAKGANTLAAATTGYVEGTATDAGNLFRSWLVIG